MHTLHILTEIVLCGAALLPVPGGWRSTDTEMWRQVEIRKPAEE